MAGGPPAVGDAPAPAAPVSAPGSYDSGRPGSGLGSDDTGTPGSAPDSDEPALPTISAAALAGRLAARERGEDHVVLLDVREPAERTIVAIPGALHVPLGEVLADPSAVAHRLAGEGAPRPDVVVHCRSGQRSAQAARALAEAGVGAVNLSGGVLAWVRDVDPSLPTY